MSRRALPTLRIVRCSPLASATLIIGTLAIAGCWLSPLFLSQDWFNAQYKQPLVIEARHSLPWAFSALWTDLVQLRRTEKLLQFETILAASAAAYGVSLVLGFVAIAIDYARAKTRVVSGVRALLMRSHFSLKEAIAWYVGSVFGVLAILLSGLGFLYPIDIYGSDVLLILAVFWFYYGLVLPFSLLLALLAYVTDAPARSAAAM